MRALNTQIDPQGDEIDIRIRLPRAWNELNQAIPAAIRERPLSCLRRLPAQVRRLCEAKGITTIGDLVALSQAQLLGYRQIGEGILQRTFQEIVQYTYFGALPEPAYLVLRDMRRRVQVARWDELRRMVPPEIAELPLSRVDLPTRMRKYAASRGLQSVGELVQRTSREMLSARNLGRRSLEVSAEAIWKLVEQKGGRYPGLAPEPPFDLRPFADFAALWKTRLGSLQNETQRMVVARRSGMSGPPETLAEIGSVLGVSRERVRQVEAKGLEKLKADGRWIDALAKKLKADRGGRVLPTAELAKDPFWSPLFSNEAFADYVFRHFFADHHALVPWGPGWVVADPGVVGLERAFQDFVRAHARADALSKAALLARARTAGERVARGAGRLFAARLEEHFASAPLGRFLVGRSPTKWDQVRAYLLASPGPVPLSRLEALFGRLPTRPPDIILVRTGQLTVPERIPGFTTWEKRLVPLCIQIMRERGPTLQWMAEDLLAALRDVTEVPDFVTPWILACMLRRSGQVRDLKRQRFALREAPADERIHFTPTLVEYVERAGRPVPRAELRAYLSRMTTFRELSFNMALTRLPLLPVDSERIGLVDRDVPGGREAMAEAARLLRGWLEERGEGMAFPKALQALREASSRFADWTPEIVAAVPRLFVDLCSNRSGIGLAEWGEVRVPTRAKIVRSLVDRGNGRARISEVVERISEIFGVEASRASLGSLAYQLGLRVEGEWLVARWPERDAV